MWVWCWPWQRGRAGGFKEAVIAVLHLVQHLLRLRQLLLRLHRELLRCSMQHCCVQLVANAEEFSGIDAVLSIEGDPPCLHSPLDGRTGDIAGTGSFREGKLRQRAIITYAPSVRCARCCKGQR